MVCVHNIGIFVNKAQYCGRTKSSALYSDNTWKTEIDVQSSNPCPISTSQTSVPQIYVFLQILISAFNSQIYGHFSLSQIDIRMPFLTFSNRHPYALTNK
jgi:hypothetical protein